MIKLVLGGFPCTTFSIAQKKKRINKVDFTADEFVRFHNSDTKWYRKISEFEKYIGDKLEIEDYKFEEGLQLFFNCIAAVDRMKEQYPDDDIYYLFENVSSMQKEIKEVLTGILAQLYGGVATEINSALLSAQNRKRIYFTNFGEIPQPEDKGILLKDILESGIVDKEKAYALKHQAGNARDYIKKHHTAVAFEPCHIVGDSKTLEAQIPKIVEKYGYLPEMFNAYNTSEITDKSPTLSTGSMVTSSCATCKLEPVVIGYRGRKKDGKYIKRYKAHPDGKANSLTTAVMDSMVAEPIRIGTIENNSKKADFDSQQYRVYSPEGKSVTLCGQGGGVGAKTGLYATPVKVGYIDSDSQGNRIYSIDGKAITISAASGGIGSKTGLYAVPTEIIIDEDTQVEVLFGGNLKIDGKLIYKVTNGQIAYKDDYYPINLPDGYYIIRKLTVNECKKLQTVPEWYIFPVSDTQAYKMLGNAWTCDVISYIMSFIPGIDTEEIEVCSLYDGMSCGRIALINLNAGDRVKYYEAYEIDKYAIQTTVHNFPDTVQRDNAFAIRDDDWRFKS